MNQERSLNSGVFEGNFEGPMVLWLTVRVTVRRIHHHLTNSDEYLHNLLFEKRTLVLIV